MDRYEPLRRITDLFIEGREVFVGKDEDGKDVLFWVNKLNSFQVEEARNDGLAARGLALAALSRDDNPELASLRSVIATWSDEQLIDNYVEGREAEINMDAINAVDSMDEWNEKLATLRRMPQLLAEMGAEPDDPRQAQLDELTTEYLGVIASERDRIRIEYRKDARDLGRSALIEQFEDQWRFQKTASEFMLARQATEIFFALRQCQATEHGRSEVDGVVAISWDHTDCDHDRQVLLDRGQVRRLPDALVERVTDTLQEVTASEREAGNWGVPASSSASSERSSEQAESEPSTPMETPVVAPTT